MKTLNRTLLSLVAVTSLVAACSTPPTGNDAAVDTYVPPATDAPADTFVPPADTFVPPADTFVPPTDVPTMGGTPCERYCTAITAACTAANAQFADAADCNAWCSGANLPVGMPGAADGNSVECRIYHAGVAAMAGMAAAHCPHAGPTGGGVCGAIDFNAGMAASFVRVDRMGMPAVSTVLVGAARKNAYNDANPNGDMAFAGDFIGSLTGLHMALDDDFAGLNLQTCSMVTLVGGLPECLGQEYAPGRTVASLVVPNDVLRLDLTAAAGFPNGRKLADPVIDVTLAVLFLRVNQAAPGRCGAGNCSPATLAGVPVNPARNDVAMGMFPDTFPYLQPAQSP